jgi:hypothetical protein
MTSLFGLSILFVAATLSVGAIGIGLWRRLGADRRPGTQPPAVPRKEE